jgi:AraC-like DNA-binding protein
MSLERYLMLRRMHLARRALRDSPLGMTTVTEIAMRYGFWHSAGSPANTSRRSASRRPSRSSAPRE